MELEARESKHRIVYTQSVLLPMCGSNETIGVESEYCRLLISLIMLMSRRRQTRTVRCDQKNLIRAAYFHCHVLVKIMRRDVCTRMLRRYL